MIRKIFVDFVIVVAVCMVVWGGVPALVFAQSSPAIHKDDLPDGVVSNQTGGNRCCLHNGDKEACGEENQEGPLKWCKDRKVDCSYTRNTYWFGLWTVTIKCSCKDWVRRQGLTDWYIPDGCACG